MEKSELARLHKLIERWESAAERLENQSVVMTANTHRLFANELKATLARMPKTETWLQKLLTKVKSLGIISTLKGK